MDKVLTFDDLSIGHGPSGLEDVNPLDWASVPAGELESLFASSSSLTSGSTGRPVWWGSGVAKFVWKTQKLFCGGVIVNSIG
jgi:hypothetical protein